MSQRSLEAPIFFTSASRVAIPFVGDDTRKIKLTKPGVYPISNPLEKHQNNIARYFIKSVSKDVNFTKDVVSERCAHTLSYKDHDTQNLFKADIVTPHHGARGEYPGRFDSRGYCRKPPSHLKKLHLPNAAGVPKRSKEAKDKIPEVESLPQTVERKKVFLTEISGDAGKTDFKHVKISKTTFDPTSDKIKDWDECVLDGLSKDTAQWIVFEGALSAAKREKLNRYLSRKYGEKLQKNELIPADASETDLIAIEKKKEMEKKVERNLKRLEMKEQQKILIKEDNEFQKTLAEYYKLPRFLRQQRSNAIKTSNEVNQTAREIKVKHFTQSPPPKMQDFLNKLAGKYIKTTDNAFEQQLYTGQAKPVHQTIGNKSRVIMDDLSEYLVAVHPVFPPNSADWLHEGEEEKVKTPTTQRAVTKGLQRWSKLPEPADFMAERGLNPPRSEKAQIDHLEYHKLDSMIKNKPMITVVEEWRSKWKIASRWQEIPISDIILDMDSLHTHVRLGAVAACAMAALHKKPSNDLAGLAVMTKDFHDTSEDVVRGHLPDALVDKVKGKLSDPNRRVSLAAAICLYSLELESKTVIDILKQNLNKGYGTNCLAAAQCLALNGDTNPEVIRMLIQLLMEHDTPSSDLTLDQREQATLLLMHISDNTRLVHSLLAEQLTSGSWKERVVACQVLAKLVGNINRDLVHKLTNLMWYDWSSEVRKAAAETLGRTGHGRHVHYELRDKLSQGNERVRVDVLKKISHLGIMTATLLPSFMACFTDQYVSVRLQACKTVGKLQLHDVKIMSELLRLMQYDPSWRIKAHAIKALTEIGAISDKIQEALIWALRFEDEPAVRMEASKALRSFSKDIVTDDDVLHVLQDRVLVEPDPLVKEEVRKTLEEFGISGPEDNMDMIQQIKNEVKRLCNKGVIAAKITLYESELEKYQNKAQYVGTGYEESCSSDYIPSIDSSTGSDAGDELELLDRLNVPTIVLTPTGNEKSLSTSTELPVLSD